MITFYRILLILIFNSALVAQDFDLTIETQVYPTGIIPGLTIEKGFGERSAAELRLGYQIIDHRDLGVQFNEEGSGYGFSLGYKYYFGVDRTGWYAGLRNDIWWNKIDWNDDPSLPISTSGTSNIMVVQPTLKAGRLWEFANGFIIHPSVGFGFEVNVSNDGEDVGEGAILLGGINIGKRF